LLLHQKMNTENHGGVTDETLLGTVESDDKRFAISDSNRARYSTRFLHPHYSIVAAEATTTTTTTKLSSTDIASDRPSSSSPTAQ
jgi:hypothetical protein